MRLLRFPTPYMGDNLPTRENVEVCTIVVSRKAKMSKNNSTENRQAQTTLHAHLSVRRDETALNLDNSSNATPTLRPELVILMEPLLRPDVVASKHRPLAPRVNRGQIVQVSLHFPVAVFGHNAIVWYVPC